MNAESLSPPRQDRPARRWVIFFFLSVLVAWALVQANVSILFPTTIAGGQVVERTTDVVWRTLIAAMLTAVASGLGMWFEARRLRWQSRLCLAACALTGLVAVLPTIISVVGLLVTPRELGDN